MKFPSKLTSLTKFLIPLESYLMKAEVITWQSISSLGIALTLAVVGQLFLKVGAGRIDAENLYASAIFNPNLIVGVGCYGMSTIFYIFALRYIPVSVAYPTIAIGYILVAIVGVFLFNEPWSMMKVFGLIAIAAGVYLIWQ